MSTHYTLNELDWALDHLLPNVAIAKGKGIQFDRPSLLKMVAWNEMLLEYSEYDCDAAVKYPRYAKAKYIVSVAAIDLHKNGYFKELEE